MKRLNQKQYGAVQTQLMKNEFTRIYHMLPSKYTLHLTIHRFNASFVRHCIITNIPNNLTRTNKYLETEEQSPETKPTCSAQRRGEVASVLAKPLLSSNGPFWRADVMRTKDIQDTHQWLFLLLRLCTVVAVT